MVNNLVMVTYRSDAYELEQPGLDHSVKQFFISHPQKAWLSSDVERVLQDKGCLGNSVSRCIRKLSETGFLIKIKKGVYKYVRD
jgi:hypothetical protein